MLIRRNYDIKVFMSRFFNINNEQDIYLSNYEKKNDYPRLNKSQLVKRKLKSNYKKGIYNFEYNDKKELVWYEIIVGEDRYKGIGTINNEWVCFHYRYKMTSKGPVPKSNQLVFQLDDVK